MTTKSKHLDTGRETLILFMRHSFAFGTPRIRESRESAADVTVILDRITPLIRYRVSIPASNKS